MALTDDHEVMWQVLCADLDQARGVAFVSRLVLQYAGQRCRIDARAGQLLHHKDVVTGLLQMRHQVIPDPAAAPRAMDEEITAHGDDCGPAFRTRQGCDK
jgi:hypothetical protein